MNLNLELASQSLMHALASPDIFKLAPLMENVFNAMYLAKPALKQQRNALVALIIAIELTLYLQIILALACRAIKTEIKFAKNVNIIALNVHNKIINNALVAQTVQQIESTAVL